MAHKRRIRRSKVRVRSLLRRIAEMEVDGIDRFRAHVRSASAAQRHSVQARAKRLSDEAQEFLADDLQELDAISNLADQLAIVALYRVVEINTGHMLAHKFGASAHRNASYVARLHQLLMQQGLDVTQIPHYRAIKELRLLNNAIKHAGHVSTELASEYPRWRQGEELSGLGVAYDRLKGRVPSYIYRFAERLKLRAR